MRPARLFATTVLWAALGLGAGLVLAVTVPDLFGYRSLIVLSGSMEPTLHVGDVAVVQQVAPLDVRVGDIVTYRDPMDSSRLVTHRIRSLKVVDGSVQFVTKGDANNNVEHWKISPEGTLGRVSYHVWRLGYALYWIRGRFGRLLLVVVPALALGAYELRRIWLPRPEEAVDEARA